jgi:hypothetical protein
MTRLLLLYLFAMGLVLALSIGGAMWVSMP